MEQLDLTEILKDCPEGTKLYSPIFGEVLFGCINDNPEYPIEVRPVADSDETGFTKEGRYISFYEDGECLLFPSKEQHDWSKFKISKPELPIDTPVMVRNNAHEGWFLRYYAKNGMVYVNGYKSIDCKGSYPYNYIIPFDKFNPDNIEGCIKEYNYGTDQ